jgi:hypothetical protein
MVIVVSITVTIFLFLIPTVDVSYAENEDPSIPFGDLSGGDGEISIQLSGTEEEPFDLSVEDFEPFYLLPEPGEAPYEGVQPAEEIPPEPEESEFLLPDIELLEKPELSTAQEEEPLSPIFSVRERDEFYTRIVGEAPVPDITRLGPLPDLDDDGVEFTDVAADWIYYQKSAGMTELRGHVMVIYDTTIISCDEAILDETNQVYKFFGEGRTFVDDADYTLECDEFEIHDADDEKVIFIKGQSTMVVYADDKAVEPGPDSSKRERVEYALKQQDTTITFTDAEFYYHDDIFDAHKGVRFEQDDKYAQSTEFHGENEIDYSHFSGFVEFWQANGDWLYQYKIIEPEEDPPNRNDRLTRALMSVPTTITCDEAEMFGEDGFLELRSFPGEIVYFYQEDKHAECETFSLWYTEEDKEDNEDPNNLLEPVVPEPGPLFTRPPGFGELKLVADFPEAYIPWQPSTWVPELPQSVHPDLSAPPVGTDFSFDFPEGETDEPGGAVGQLAELGEHLEEVTAPPDQSDVHKNEIIMDGSVFFRQENGDWLFVYDVVREEDESEESVEQIRKWANGQCDYFQVWMDDEIVEATGNVYAEQDNQNLKCDFARYIGEFDMAYLTGSLEIFREEKNHLLSNEGFLFFTTKVFEALGEVQTTVMVDVEERTRENRETAETETENEEG